MPYPIALVLVGLAVGARARACRRSRVDPDVVFLVFLPPLLASAGFYSSPRELRAELRPLTFLAVGLVLATMGGVAVVAHALIDGLRGRRRSCSARSSRRPTRWRRRPRSAACTCPSGSALLVEGEAMINDATALVAFRVALGAAIAGSFSVADAGVDFVVSAAAGIAIGLAAGWLEVPRAAQARRPAAGDPAVAAVPPTPPTWSPRSSHVSGVLAAVVGGLYLGWFAHEAFSADTRLSASAFWEVLVFGLNALLFLLLGLQFPAIVDDACAGARSGTLLAARRSRWRRGRGADPARRACSCRCRGTGRRLARAAGDRLERHARRDLARGRAVGARRPCRPARSSCS